MFSGPGLGKLLTPYEVQHQHNAVFIVARTYSVPSPNSLWHIDGNHKMIKWRLVIHGSIDGYSRLITFLHCYGYNNRASTVFPLFRTACDEYGIPSRVRTDKGGENVEIWHWMESVRGSDRGSYIAGASVHNTRIERVWRDVYSGVTSTFVRLFNMFEDKGILDSTNPADLFCLHYVYIPRINACLTSFRNAWNHHGLSSEHNQSPLQLFTCGIVSVDDSTITDDPLN